MGGTISITLRVNNEEVYKMDRSTNILPYFLAHHGLYSGLGADLDSWKAEFLEKWLEMKDDWDKNHETGQFQFPMTPCYMPGGLTSPSGYGLVVIDIPSKSILSLQGYCSVGCVRGYHTADADTKAQVKQLFRAGMLKRIVYGDNSEEADVSQMTFDDLCAMLKDVHNIKFRYGGLLLETGWKYLCFDETSDGAKQFRTKLGELGYVFSQEEEESWLEWIKDQEEMEEDE